MKDLLEHPVVEYLLERGGWVVDTNKDFRHIQYVHQGEMRALLHIPLEQVPLIMAIGFAGQIAMVKIPNKAYFEMDIVPTLEARLLLETAQ
jgi:hypothetical protein